MEYLLEIENCYRFNSRSFNNVTPLWCASVAGKYRVVDVLVRYGADVNSMSDTGSTPGENKENLLKIFFYQILFFSLVCLFHYPLGHCEVTSE